MKINTLIKTTCLAVVMLVTACSKDKNAAPGGTSFTQYYIAGQYSANLSSTATNVPVPYAIIFNSDSKCTFADAVFGVVVGSYTYSNGHLVTNFGETGGSLVATFDFTVTNGTITQASPDGLGLLTYKLEITPATNAFSNGQYTGGVTTVDGTYIAYLSFSDSQFNIGQSGYNTPDIVYTLQNNAVATRVFNNVTSVFVFDNGAVMMMNYIPPAAVNGSSAYEYGTLTK